MTNKQTVSDILDRRRATAKLSRDQRVASFYEDHPDFLALRDDIKKTSQDLILAMLQKEDTKPIQDKLDQLHKEEEAFLNDHNMTKDFFEPDYTCKICNDEGFVDGKSCSCRKQLLVDQNYDQSKVKEKLKEQNFSTFKLDIFRKSRQQGEEVSPYENMKDLVQALTEEYVPYFSTKSPNLYFYGPTGTGKTFLVNSIAKGLLDRGYTVLYQTAGELLEFLVNYNFMFVEDKESNYDRHQFVFDVDLLIIDDLGTEFVRDQTVAALFDLINSRLVGKKPVILSSNIELEELGDYYDQRIASRIQGEYTAFEIYGNDLRRQL